MSYIDLATLTMHRRNELESRLNVFYEKCNRAIEDIKRLKMKTESFVPQLNCEPAELKDRFLKCMKQLEEYMYLITDFNLAIGHIDEMEGTEFTPVLDTTATEPQSIVEPQPLNLMDVLTEPTPSTSASCSNRCPPEKPKRAKVPKEDQILISFSSASSSEETVKVNVKCEMTINEVKHEYQSVNGHFEDLSLEDHDCNLPAQSVLEMEHLYNATIMHVDGPWIWVITDSTDDMQTLILDMTDFYSHDNRKLTAEDVMSFTCCAFLDEECFYRGLFLRLNEDEPNVATMFLVDTGEIRSASIDCIKPLHPRFCAKPPFARCCHLAGVDLQSCNDKSLMEAQEQFMKEFVGTQCTIEIDDNTSESLGVYVILPSGKTLNKIIVQQGLAQPIDKPADVSAQPPNVVHGPPPEADSELDITDCPEHEDPVEAVTGYHNRDEADICKHYKGGPEKTCFKGARCTKRHVMKHPDGWTLDRSEVLAKCKSLPLPAPNTWHRALVTCVCHYDRVYVQLLDDKEEECDERPKFGEVLQPTTLASLVRDMNSQAARCAYKPLDMAPAPGELVAALYPLDNNWYRARVLSVTRSDQSVEVKYIDYGTVLWVKEHQVRRLEARLARLAAQARRCALAGVRGGCPRRWADAKRALAALALDKHFDLKVVSREYDEITVELYDAEGYSVADKLAATNLVELVEYSVVDDTNVTQKLVVP